MRCLAPTMSLISVWRAGCWNACTVPAKNPVTYTCQGCTRCSRTSVARITFKMALVTCARISWLLRLERSATAPARIPKKSSGRPRSAVANPSCSADPVIWYMSQPRVI